MDISQKKYAFIPQEFRLSWGFLEGTSMGESLRDSIPLCSLMVLLKHVVLRHHLLGGQLDDG